METMLIIFLIAIAALIIAFALRFLKGTLKIAAKIMIIIIIILIIGTVFIYNDLSKLKDDVLTKKSIFVLKENTTYYAAVGIEPSESQEFDLDSFEYYDAEAMEKLIQSINEKNFSSIGAARIFIVTPKLLNKTFNIDLDLSIDENDIIEILKSGTPYDVFSEKIKPELSYSPDNLKNAYGSEEKLKGYLLAVTIINYFKEPNADLIRNMKQGHFEILPTSNTFKVIKLMPFI